MLTRTGAGIALAVLAMLIFGGQFPIAKSTLSALDSVHLTLYRFLIALACMIPVLAAVEGWRALAYSGAARPLLFLGAIGMSLSPLCAFTGNAFSGPEHAAIILALQPSIIAIARWMLRGQRPAGFTVGCIAIAFVGVACVVTRGRLEFGGSNDELFGDFLVLLSSLTWVTYVLGVERITTLSAFRLTTLSGIAGCVTTALIAFAATATGWITRPDTTTLAGVLPQLVYLGIGGVFIAMIAWNAAVQRLGAVDAMLYQNLIPVVAFAIGYWQGKRFEPIEIAGAALVVASLFANSLYLRRVRRVQRVTPA